MNLSALLAHQGGWDETALIAVPILVIIVVLAIAKRRVDAVHTTANTSAPGDPDERRASSAD